jgi:hypothetical protein
VLAWKKPPEAVTDREAEAMQDTRSLLLHALWYIDIAWLKRNNALSRVLARL